MKNLTITLFAITSLHFSASIAFAQAPNEIAFEDPMIEAAAREQLKWSGLANDQPLTQSHLEKITYLWFEDDGEERVKNLNDLRHFTNLRSLEIWNASGITSL